MEAITTMRKVGLAAIAASLLAASVPAVAQAAPTRVTGGQEQESSYQLKAAPGTVNNVGVSLTSGGSRYVFSDSAGLVTPLYASCEAPDGGNAADGVHQTLICSAPTSVRENLEEPYLRIESGDGNDRVDVALLNTEDFRFTPVIIKGEEGNDTISASGPAVRGTFNDPLLDGGPGNDLLRSGGNHKLKGKGGIDRIFAKNGVKNLKINCGPGSDKKESAKVDRKDPKAKSC
jgi:hypothetical protein